MVALFLAEGFEEIEAVTPADLLRRAGVEVRTCSVTGERRVTGSHGIPVLCDETLESVGESFDMMILPGGMPGTRNLAASARLSALLKKQDREGGFIAAICAAPTVLGGLGLLKGKKATCYPGMEGQLEAGEILQEEVVRDGHIVTSRGAGTAWAFGLALVALLKGEDEARRIGEATVYGRVLS